MLLALFEALRPRQWTKNLILFAPLVFAQKLGDPDSVGRAVAAFGVFCLLSGSVYLLNDLRDLEQDRLHPVKSKRPIASGRLAPGTAWLALGVIAVAALVGAALLSPSLMIEAEVVHPGADRSVPTREPSFLAMAVLYLALQLGYSIRFKHVVILDVLVISIGFVIRAVAGAAVIAVVISPWLLVCTIFLALFLALSKRRHEVVLMAGDARQHRATLGEYDPYLLDQMISVVAAACVISYALYTMDEATVVKFGTTNLNLTIPFVLYGLFRYLYIVHRKEDGGDPSASLLADRPLLLAVLLWGLAAIAILYL